ncbi:MAG: hypothetical protein Q9193_004790 [Seirophora villosa]
METPAIQNIYHRIAIDVDELTLTEGAKKMAIIPDHDSNVTFTLGRPWQAYNPDGYECCMDCFVYFLIVEVLFCPVPESEEVCADSSQPIVTAPVVFAVLCCEDVTAAARLNSLYSNSSHVGAVSTVKAEGFTLASPSVYIAFGDVSAGNVCELVGQKHTSITLGFAPGDLFTVTSSVNGSYDPAAAKSTADGIGANEDPPASQDPPVGEDPAVDLDPPWIKMPHQVRVDLHINIQRQIRMHQLPLLPETKTIRTPARKPALVPTIKQSPTLQKARADHRARRIPHPVTIGGKPVGFSPGSVYVDGVAAAAPSVGNVPRPGSQPIWKTSPVNLGGFKLTPKLQPENQGNGRKAAKAKPAIVVQGQTTPRGAWPVNINGNKVAYSSGSLQAGKTAVYIVPANKRQPAAPVELQGTTLTPVALLLKGVNGGSANDQKDAARPVVLTQGA